MRQIQVGIVVLCLFFFAASVEAAPLLQDGGKVLGPDDWAAHTGLLVIMTVIVLVVNGLFIWKMRVDNRDDLPSEE